MNQRQIFCAGLAALALLVSASKPARAAEPDDELVQMVLGLLEDPDKDLRALGLEQVRTAAPGEAATRRFADRLAKLPVETQPGLLSALAERGDASALPVVRQALASREQDVRVAAIAALGRLGSVEDLDALLKLRTADAAVDRKAAQLSLVQLRGEEVARSLAARLAKSPTDLRIALLDVLVERRAQGAAAQILPLAVDDQAAVRGAAMQALGHLAAANQLPGMLAGVLKSAAGEERDAAEKAVMFACQRIEDVAERSRQILVAYQTIGQRDQPTLLPTLGRVGGPEVLGVVESALAAPAQREAGLRAICNWPDASVAGRLVELFQAEKDAKRQTMLLLALVRVAPLPDGRDDRQRLELLEKVYGMCSRQEDKTLVIKRARAVRTIETLRFVLPLVEQPALAEAACETVVELAHHRNLREPNKAEFDAALDKVLATSRDATNRDRAERYKKGQTWVRPKS